MKRRLVIALLGASALVACAPTPNANPISREVRQTLTFSEINVTTSGAAFDSTRASERSSSLGPDLQAWMKRELADRMSPGGATLAVDIAKLNVAGSTTTRMGRDQSQLQGSIRVLDGDGQLLGTYQINVVAGQAAETTAGALASAAVQSADGYYRSLLDAFARDAREQILGAELPGQRLLRQING